MKIAFWDNCLCERGTSVSLYDYAYYNQTILGNQSIILFNKTNKNNHINAIKKFNNNFTVFGVTHFSEVDIILENEKCDILYVIKGGENEGQFSKKIKTVIHCVFNCNEPHGDIYSSIGPWISGNNGKYPVVPHMINLPNHNNNMRQTLNIEEDALVYGSYAGKNEFNIPFVKESIAEICKLFENDLNYKIYFIFANINKFIEHKNVIFMDAIVDLNEKVRFINTCDAMVHAQHLGETFGLSIAEFSSKNKPIISLKGGTANIGHVHLLGYKALWYLSKNDFMKIILNFDKKLYSKFDWNAYRDYNPRNVMNIFKKVYID